jgi:hypothetical protein
MQSTLMTSSGLAAGLKANGPCGSKKQFLINKETQS